MWFMLALPLDGDTGLLRIDVAECECKGDEGDDSSSSRSESGKSCRESLCVLCVSIVYMMFWKQLDAVACEVEGEMMLEKDHNTVDV